MANRSDARDIARGATASLFGFGGRLVARIVLMILAGRAYGIESLGVLGQVAAIVEIAGAIGVLGLKRSLLDMLSSDEESGCGPERRVVEAVIVALGFGGLISAGLIFVWPYVVAEHTAMLPFLLLAVPMTIFTDVALTATKFRRIIRWDVGARCIAEPWAFLGLALLFFALGNVEHGLLLAYAGSLLAAALVALYGLIRVYGFTALATSHPRLTAIPNIIKQTAPVGATDIGVMMLRRIDLIMLGLFVGANGVGLYYMAQQVSTVPHKINGLFEPMMSPVIAKLHNRRDARGIRTNLVAVCRWVFIIQLGLTIPMIVFVDVVLSIFGPEFAVGGMILSIILIAELIDGTFASTETPLVFARPSIPPKLQLITLGVEVVTIAVFAHYWGAQGAAWGFLTALSGLAAMRIMMLQRALKIRVVNAGFLAPTLIAGIVGTVMWLSRTLVDSDHGAVVTLTIVIGILAFAGLIKAFALTRLDRVLFRAISPRKRITAS